MKTYKQKFEDLQGEFESTLNTIEYQKNDLARRKNNLIKLIESSVNDKIKKELMFAIIKGM
jgi:hypothetical protein